MLSLFFFFFSFITILFFFCYFSVRSSFPLTYILWFGLFSTHLCIRFYPWEHKYKRPNHHHQFTLVATVVAIRLDSVLRCSSMMVTGFWFDQAGLLTELYCTSFNYTYFLRLFECMSFIKIPCSYETSRWIFFRHFLQNSFRAVLFFRSSPVVIVVVFVALVAAEKYTFHNSYYTLHIKHPVQSSF